MKTGINDKILNSMLKLQNKSISKIKNNLSGVKPFAAKKVPTEDLIYAKNNIGFKDLEELSKEFGVDNVSKLMYDINLSEERRDLKGVNDGRT